MGPQNGYRHKDPVPTQFGFQTISASLSGSDGRGKGKRHPSRQRASEKGKAMIDPKFPPATEFAKANSDFIDDVVPCARPLYSDRVDRFGGNINDCVAVKLDCIASYT